MTQERHGVGLTTWSDLGRTDGNLLLVINSPAHQEVQVAAILAAVETLVPSERLHVVAHPDWREWLTSRGVCGDRVLFSIARVSAAGVEVNHFLEATDALLWIVPRAFRVITGSTPHSLYNEEVQPVFEQRVSLIIRDGVFLAHALPSPYVYVFDAAALGHRRGRALRVDAYTRRARQLTDALHHAWRSRGEPDAVDEGDRSETIAILRRYLGDDIVAYDEASPIVAPVSGRHLDQDSAAMMDHFLEALHARDLLIAERSEAVEVRDRIIEQLNRDGWPARIRRFLGRAD